MHARQISIQSRAKIQIGCPMSKSATLKSYHRIERVANKINMND